MVSEEEISLRTSRMRDAIGAAYGFKARDLRRAIKRAGRRLPKAVRGELQKVTQAEGFGGHPKLLRRVDMSQLAAAETALNAHLKTIDRAALRKTALIGWAAQAAFYILLVGGAFMGWMATTGQG